GARPPRGGPAPADPPRPPVAAQADVGQGGGVDLAAYREDRLGGQDGLVEVAGDAGQGGQEEVAERVADEPPAVGEAVLEEAGQEGLLLGQGRHAVAGGAPR